MHKRDPSLADPLPASGRSWRRALAHRQNALDSAIVAFPLFVIYQIGILGSESKNGADVVTHWLITLSQSDSGLYLLFFAVATVAYGVALWFLAQTSNWNRRTALLTLIESSFYALSLGSLVNVVMRALSSVLPGLNISTASANLLDIVVIACGAGVHEELIFRVLGVGALSSLLALRVQRKTALFWCVLLSSVLFSLAHHLGAMGEAFTLQAFVFRTLAGVVFALIYLSRGAGVAIWTHALYDIYVMSVLTPPSP